jgi:hypothetical protein
MGQGTPGPIAVDAGRIYFVGGTSIYSMATDGTALVTLATPGSVSSIAVDATSLYYFTSLRIDSIPLGGGTPTMLATTASSAGALAVDATDLYWAESSSVNKVPIGGGTPLTLTTGSVGPNTIALDAAYVYFAYTSTVYRTPLAGGSMTPLGSSTSSTVLDIAVDATAVYYAAGLIGAFAIDGSTNETLVSASLPQRIAIDADNVYFFNGTSLSRIPKSGGDVTILAIDMYPGDLTVDATSVYWTSRGADGVTGAVMKVAK